jgi:alanine racemase
MKKELRLGLRTWLEINNKSIAHNYKAFRATVSPKTKMLGVVKSNAYGHNIFEFSEELEKLGIDYLAVDSVVEGIALRREGIKIPILILGYTLPEMLEKAVNNDLDITISNFDYFKQIKKLKPSGPIKAHIKVDTGMHRHGFQIQDINKVIKILKNNTSIKTRGLYTHFANAKDPNNSSNTKKQIEIYNIWRDSFKESGFDVLCHACATSGLILFPEAHFDMVRVGIGMYGIWPSDEVKDFAKNKFSLKPVLSWKTIVGEIKDLNCREGIGYDFTEKVKRKSRVAVLPVGYWHGYPRALSNIGQVLIKGKSAKVLGRICMDILMVDITDIKGVRIGDEVTIIGSSNKDQISIKDVADLIKVSPYELVTRINPLIKRIYTN